MSHKDAPPETQSQTDCRLWWQAYHAGQGVTVGWGRDKHGNFLSQFARDAEAAWRAAQVAAREGVI